VVYLHATELAIHIHFCAENIASTTALALIRGWYLQPVMGIVTDGKTRCSFIRSFRCFEWRVAAIKKQDNLAARRLCCTEGA
jgi:hypothetical protein